MFRAKRFAVLLLAAFVYLLYWHRSSDYSGDDSSSAPPPLPNPPWERPGGDASDLDEAVANATLGFQRIFVINLPARTDRRDSTSLAAALTGMNVEYVDGVDGADVQDRVLPPRRWAKGRTISKGNKGSWRAHINVLRTIVEQNLSSALILEDDTDWDVRLKAELQTFAAASRAYLQPQRRRWHSPGPSLSSLHPFTSSSPSSEDDSGIAIPLPEIPRTTPPRTSPYGDGWDVLWLGHCGTDLPSPSPSSSSSTSSSLRVVIPDDETVPIPKHLRPHPFANPDRVGLLHPPHTRAVHAAAGTICTQAYAVSARGARKLLLRLGVETLSSGFDIMLRDWCDGRRLMDDDDDEDAGDEKNDGGGKRRGGGGGDGAVCLTVQPPLFSHFWPARDAGGSDITGQGGGYLRPPAQARSQYVRLSVRRNFARLVRGDGVEDLVDQWPDED